MTDIVMPKLSDSMQEGTILSWLKEPGAQVEVGEDLLEIETDKATVTHPAQVAGVLEILVAEGTTVAVGETIGRVQEGVAVAPGVAMASGVSGAPAVSRAASETALGSSGVVLGDGAAEPVGGGNGQRRGIATPLARRVAAVHGLALQGVTGTGPLGRITRADVLREAGIAPEAPARPVSPPPLPAATRPVSPPPLPAATRPVSPPPLPAAGSGGATLQEPTRRQQLIARRMAEAKATIPHFQVQTEATMDAAVELRARLAALADDGDPVPTVNDMIVKASALALREHPLANGSFIDGGFELHDAVNVGVAVATDGALVVPTVLDADRKSLGQIAREARRLAERVRSGEVTPAELSGATFTVSNLGMFGMTAITPVINPPQAAILGVGALRPGLVRVDGEIADRTLLTLTLSCDHRILYGVDAARFLARIRDLLEAPLKLAL